MSIITKKKTTETFLASLDTLPKNTQRSQKNTVKKFTIFLKETQNLTPDQFCEELLIMKKQDEEEYINTLYTVLQDFIDDMNSRISANSVKTNFAYLRTYLYYLGIRTNPQDVKMMLKFAKISHEEKYPLNVEELRMIVDNFTRYPVIRACWLAQSSSGMRIGEVLAIRKRDLVFKERIQVYIKAKGSKNLRGRTVFLSKECQEAIEIYLDDLKDNDFVFYKGVTEDEKCRSINMSRNLRVCLDRIGLGMRYEDGSYKISTHSLRAFFFTQAVRKHGENYAHRMTGHSGYLMQYDRMNDEEKLKMYIELEADLSMYDLTKANLEIERLKTLQTKENKELKEELDELKIQLAQQGLDIVDKLKDDGKIL